MYSSNRESHIFFLPFQPILPMTITFTNIWSTIRMCPKTSRTFRSLFYWRKRLSLSNYNWWWIVDSLLWTRMKIMVRPVEKSLFTRNNKTETKKSTDKVLYSFFWNHKGMILKELILVDKLCKCISKWISSRN